MDLNSKQIQAVKSIQFPTLVIAVPGAGKTKVIVEKYLYLYRLGFSIERLVAITFTNKAANEMLLRLKAEIPKFNTNPYISTVHSFALRLMVENKELFGFKKGSTVIDESDSKEILTQIISDNNLDFISIDEATKFIEYSKETFQKDVIFYCYKKAHHILLNDQKLIQYKKENIKVIDEFGYKYFDDEYLNGLLTIFSKYQKYLYKSSLFDYADLILYPLLTMILSIEVREKIRNFFDYILVDEYQDINNLQNQFLIMISNGANITAVGDEDQSIYGFRGASIEPIMNFENNFKNAKIIYMEQNYRSKIKIINCANSLIISNKNRRNKTVKPIKDESGEVELRIFRDESSMIEFIKSRIIYLNSLNIPLNEIAILVRASWLHIKIQNKLIEDSIPYQILRGTNFFERKEIKYALYYISFKLNKDNEFLFIKICNYPKRGIGPKTIEKITKIKDEKNIDFIVASSFIENSKVIEFGKFLNKLIKQDDIVEFFNMLLSEGGFEKEWKNEGEDIYFERKENFELLIKIAQNLQKENKNENIDIFQLFLSKVIPFYKDNEDKNGVILGTLHSSKGLEFEAVFLPYVSDTILPYKRYQQEADEEEERRLLYVGMTRAKSYLYLLHPSTIDIRGQELAFSRLATQLVPDYLIEDQYQNNEFNIGEYIESKGYGYGKIIGKKRLRNGKILYIVETENGTMQFIDGMHELRKKIFDY